MLSEQETTAMIAKEYGLLLRQVERIGNDSKDRAVYHGESDDGAQWIVRLGNAAATFSPWIPAPTMATWMHQQAALLDWCARHGAWGPPVRPTSDGALVCTYHDTLAIVLGFVPGQMPPATAESWALVGRTFGSLHQAGGMIGAQARAVLPHSWWSPLEHAIAIAHDMLRTSTPIPARWHNVVAAAKHTLDECRSFGSLPETVIHGDYWLGNSVLSSAGELVLIDWEFAGRGPAVIDIGSVLGECYDDSVDPEAIDTAGIDAIIHSYQRFRPLSAAEREALLPAIRFRTAFLIAIRCFLGHRQGWPESIERALEREGARLRTSAAIAERVRNVLERVT